jgi:hypothetical protein
MWIAAQVGHEHETDVGCTAGPHTLGNTSTHRQCCSLCSPDQPRFQTHTKWVDGGECSVWCREPRRSLTTLQLLRLGPSHNKFWPAAAHATHAGTKAGTHTQPRASQQQQWAREKVIVCFQVSLSGGKIGNRCRNLAFHRHAGTTWILLCARVVWSVECGVWSVECDILLLFILFLKLTRRQSALRRSASTAHSRSGQ